MKRSRSSRVGESNPTERSPSPVEGAALEMPYPPEH